MSLMFATVSSALKKICEGSTEHDDVHNIHAQYPALRLSGSQIRKTMAKHTAISAHDASVLAVRTY